MSAEGFISPRTSLKSVIAAHPQVSSLTGMDSLLQDFDMCRVVATKDKDSAVKFGVLEHLMRPSTPNELVETMFSFMARPLALKLSDVVDRKEETGELAIREMEAIVTAEDLTESDEMPALQVWYRASSTSITKHQNEPDLEGTWPVVHLFDSPSLRCLLYSNEVTFLDAYNPLTGGHKPSLITPLLVHSIVPSLYFAQTRRSFSTQTKPPLSQEQPAIRVPSRPLTMVRPLVLTPSPESSLLEGSQVAPLFTDHSEDDFSPEKLPDHIESPRFSLPADSQSSIIAVIDEYPFKKSEERTMAAPPIPEIRVAEPQRAVEVDSAVFDEEDRAEEDRAEEDRADRKGDKGREDREGDKGREDRKGDKGREDRKGDKGREDREEYFVEVPKEVKKERPKSVPKSAPKVPLKEAPKEAEGNLQRQTAPSSKPRQSKPVEEQRVSSRKLIIHRSRANRRTTRRDGEVMEGMDGNNWEWVQLDKQATKLNRERDGCGNECSLF